MDLASCKVDELLCLTKYIGSNDRFTLAISGVLDGFEKASVERYLGERIEGIGVQFRPHPDYLHRVEIRSLNINGNFEQDELLAHLFGQLYFQHVGHLDVSTFVWSAEHWMTRAICSMDTLHELIVCNTALTLGELDLVLHNCRNITRLAMSVFQCQTCSSIKIERAQGWKDRFRTAFQRLKYLKFSGSNCGSSLQEITQMLMWAANCTEQCFENISYQPDWDCVSQLAIDSQPEEADFGTKMQTLTISHISPCDWLQWLLKLYPSITKLHLTGTSQLPDPVLVEISQLRNLRELNLAVNQLDGLRDIVEQCKELQCFTLEMDVPSVPELKEQLDVECNIQEFHLIWRKGPPASKIVPVLQKWRLRRLTLTHLNCLVVPDPIYFSSQLLCQSLTKLTHLTHLDLDECICDSHVNLLNDKIKQFIDTTHRDFHFNFIHKHL